MKIKLKPWLYALLTAAAAAITAVLTLTSCTVTRTITNKSEYHQRGDTTVVIQTKTIENYNAKKNQGAI